MVPISIATVRVDYRCRQAYQQRQPSTDDEAAQDITADLIGAHQVLQRRPGEPVGQMPLGDRIGRDEVGEDGHQDQREDHQATGQAHALPGQRAQELEHGVAPYRFVHW